MESMMLTRPKRMVASVFATALAAVAIAAPTATAQPQIGLVNIDLDVSRNNIAIPVSVNAAANICGVEVDVLTSELLTGDRQADCDADANQTVELRQNQ
jgi:hypothetical protein